MAVVTININGTKETFNIDGPKEAIQVKVYDALGKINVWRRNTKVASFVVNNLESYSYSVTDEAPPAQESGLGADTLADLSKLYADMQQNSRHPSKTELMKMETVYSRAWDEVRLEFQNVSKHFCDSDLDKFKAMTTGRETVEVDLDMTVRELFAAILEGGRERLLDRSIVRG